MPRGIYLRKPRPARLAPERVEPQETTCAVLQPKVTTTSALFIGGLVNVGHLLSKDFVITLRVFEGFGKFIFSDESAEARLIFLADEGTHRLRADDFAGSLTGKALRLSAADPAPGSGPKSGRGRSAIARVTYQCSLTTSTREDI